MRWLEENIRRIEELVVQGTPASLTYAALECRLAIELVVYERLKTAHPYISHRDLVKWTPGRVVTQLIAEVDPYIASTRTFSISREPVDSECPATLADFQKQDYIEIGTQIGFDAKTIGKLWQALSGFLHVTLPKTENDPLNSYGDVDLLRKKTAEAVVELKRLASGTLIANVTGPRVFCECLCGSTIRRRAESLSDGQVIHCVNSECYESYRVEIHEGEYLFERRSIPVACESCGAEARLASRELEERLKPGAMATMVCDKCGESTYITWRLMKAGARQMLSE